MYTFQSGFVTSSAEAHNGLAYLNGGRRGLLIAEPAFIQGMEFDYAIIFQKDKQATFNPAMFKHPNRCLRAKFKLATINIFPVEETVKESNNLSQALDKVVQHEEIIKIMDSLTQK